jgi:hypothetical protein
MRGITGWFKMPKAYVTSCKEEPQELSTRVTLEFDPSAHNAAIWETKGQADNACRNFEAVPIEIRGSGVCKDFQVEELAPKQFVVFCDYPSQL